MSSSQPRTPWSAASKAASQKEQPTAPLQASTLVLSLCSALEAAEVRYCHWKSTTALNRSATGANDLDLLIDRGDEVAFRTILASLGFKPAEPPATSKLPGVRDYYGYDAEADLFIHVHVHYQLIFGHDASKNYCLPVEGILLDSATKCSPFLVPAVEYEFLIFVLRMVLKHCTLAALVTGQSRLSESEERERRDLMERTDPQLLTKALHTLAPFLPISFFDRCRKAVDNQINVWHRIVVASSLQSRLSPFARRSRWRDTSLVFWRRFTGIVRRVLGKPGRYRLASGGEVIALVGGDGAGKTTSLDELEAWLSPVFDIRRVHFGRPSWSWTTRVVRGSLKVLRTFGLGQYESPSIRYLQPETSGWHPSLYLMLREVCTARDRYLTYKRAHRAAANGCLVLCDRYPLAQLEQMDSRLIDRVVPEERRNRIIRWMISLEANYYVNILWPDCLFVLRLDPEIAMQRKMDQHPLAARARVGEIWDMDWEQTAALQVDASRSQQEVVAELKARLWSVL